MKPKLIPFGEMTFIDYNDNMSFVCKEHMMRADDMKTLVYGSWQQLPSVKCLEGPHIIALGDKPDNIRELLSRRISSKKYQDAEYLDIDGYLVPASKEVQDRDKKSEFFVTAQIKNSEKKGEQLVVYAGKKGQKGKSQIFIDPKSAKMTFDQNDINPNDVFVKLEATFRNGSRTVIEDISGEEK